MLTNRRDLIRIERLVTANDHPSYRMSICRGRHGPPTFLESETTASLLSEFSETYSVENVDDSTRFDSNRTTRYSKWRSVIADVDLHKKANIQSSVDDSHGWTRRYYGSPFAVTIHSIRVESCRFDNIWIPPSQILAEYFPSVLQIDIRCDGSSFEVTSRSIPVQSCRFDSMFNPPSQILAEYFLSVLQIDIRY